MFCQWRALFTFCFIIILIVCLFGVEASATKKWRAHIKKKPSPPKISATFRTVPSKHNSVGKHFHDAAHKYNPDWLFSAAPFWNDLPLHDAAPSYYLAASYPRWHTNALKKIDYVPPFIPLLSYAQRHFSPLRRADALGFESPSLSTTPLFDMSEHIFEGDLTRPPMASTMIMPPSLMPLDYKSFLADADFSLMSDRFNHNRRLDMNGMMFVNPFDAHFD